MRDLWRSAPLSRFYSAALFSTLALVCSCSKSDTSPDVLLIIIDTLRADHVGCYGAEIDVTPNMNRIASEGVRFSQCVTPVPVTLPSVASILTSSYPIYHGVRDNGIFTLDRSLVTMAELFNEEGYSTGAVVGSYVLTKGTGVEQGFDFFDADFSGNYKLESSLLPDRAEEVSETQRRAEEVTDRAKQWLEGIQSPFFLVVHYFDPHGPYDPPPQYLERYPKKKYLAEVAYTDDQLGPLLEAARAAAEKSGRDALLTALVADHGEGLGQHGEKEHGFFIYDSTLLVPFLLSYPGHVRAAGVIDEQVSCVDLAPTVLNLAGLDVPESWQGTSLHERIGGAVAEGSLDDATHLAVPASSEETTNAPGSQRVGGDSGSKSASGKGPPPRAQYIETYRTRYSYNWSELVGIRYNGWKLVRAPQPELYNFASDPQERENLYEEEPQRVRQMEELFEGIVEEWLGPLSETEPLTELDEEKIKKLQALGYVTPKAQKPSGPLPDPKEMMESQNRRLDSKELVKAARPFAAKGDLDAAEALLKKALELDPSNATAINDLGLIEWERGHQARAIQFLREATRVAPGEASPRYNLGIMYLDTKRYKEARAELEVAAVLRADDAKTRLHYGRALEETGEPRVALEQYQSAIELDPGLFAAYYRAAVILVRLGRTDEAAMFLEDMLKREPPEKLGEAAGKLLREIGGSG